MTERIDTIVVGAGQAGLSTSYYLKQHGRDHLILEQAKQAVPAWRNRWDSFTLITPNWMFRLPGAEYQGDNPDGFMDRDNLVALFETYIERLHPPIRYETEVRSVERIDAGYRVRTDKGDFAAANVVIATGMFQTPRIPLFSTKISSDIHQLHSSEYRNPEALPAGAVLVVGSAQSGCQIAEELYQTGRKVYFCVGNAGRVPRRYRGKEVTRWLAELGFFDRTVDKLPSPKAKFAGSIQGTGKDGGHSINLHQFARDGVILLGHIQDAQENRLILAPDLMETLAKTDQAEADFIKQVNAYIETTGQDAPRESLPELRDGYQAELVSDLDLKSAGISSVIWATGYKFDYSMVKLPVFDEDGYPVQERGVTEYPGLYFVGLPFLDTGKSGLLFGVGENAAHIVSVISGNDRAIRRG
jgi:putative flavoprotein involved in K+ transport